MRPLVEVAQLLHNRLGFVLVAVEAPVEAATNVAPGSTVFVAGVAPPALALHGFRSPERLAVVDVFAWENAAISAMHAVLRAQKHVPRIEHERWKTIRKCGAGPLTRRSPEPVTQRFENGRKGDAADAIDLLVDEFGVGPGFRYRKQGLLHLLAKQALRSLTAGCRWRIVRLPQRNAARKSSSRRQPTSDAHLRQLFPVPSGKAKPRIRAARRHMERCSPGNAPSLRSRGSSSVLRSSAAAVPITRSAVESPWSSWSASASVYIRG